MIFTVLQLLVGIFSGIGLCLDSSGPLPCPHHENRTGGGKPRKEGQPQGRCGGISLKDFCFPRREKSGSANTARQVLRQICGRRAWIPRPKDMLRPRTQSIGGGYLCNPVFFVAKVLSLVVLAIAVTVGFWSTARSEEDPHPPHKNRIRTAETGRHG